MLTDDDHPIVVKLGSTTLTKDTDYTLQTVAEGKDSAENIVITLTATGLAKITDNTSDSIIITYSAKINSSAISLDAVHNKVSLTYEKDNTTTTEYDHTDTGLYGFDIIKTDNSETPKALTGAQFTLQKDNANGQYYQGADADPMFADASKTFTVTDASGKLTFRGLPAGTYYLVETKAPDNYIKSDPITVVIKDDGTVTATKADGTAITVAGGSSKTTDEDSNVTGTIKMSNFNVVNIPKGDLPTSGGIGTTMLYVIGGLLVAGAIAALVIRKKKGLAK